MSAGKRFSAKFLLVLFWSTSANWGNSCMLGFPFSICCPFTGRLSGFEQMCTAEPGRVVRVSNPLLLMEEQKQKQMRRGTCLPINYRYPPLITPIATSYAIRSLILSGFRGFQENQRNKSALLELVISTKVEKTSTSAPHHAWLLTPLHCIASDAEMKVQKMTLLCVFQNW